MSYFTISALLMVVIAGLTGIVGILFASVTTLLAAVVVAVAGTTFAVLSLRE